MRRWRCGDPARKATAQPSRRERRRGRLRADEQYRDLAADDRPGRRHAALTPLQRRALGSLLVGRPSVSLAELRRRVPGLPRNAAAAYLRRWRRLSGRRQRRRRRILRWLVPGAVWAIDGTWLLWPVPPLGRRALIVVELCGGQVLALESVAGERASEAERVLEALIAKHGAPLVLKLDNGPAFIAQRFAAFCHRHGITLLYSPPRTPRYNGCCEVRGRWAKRDAQAAAERRGAFGQLCQADLDAAVAVTPALPRIAPLVRRHFQAVVATQLHIAAAPQGLAAGSLPADHRRRSLTRVAVRRALKLCHILSIQGRAYRQCLSPSAA